MTKLTLRRRPSAGGDFRSWRARRLRAKSSLQPEQVENFRPHSKKPPNSTASRGRQGAFSRTLTDWSRDGKSAQLCNCFGFILLHYARFTAEGKRAFRKKMCDHRILTLCALWLCKLRRINLCKSAQVKCWLLNLVAVAALLFGIVLSLKCSPKVRWNLPPNASIIFTVFKNYDSNMDHLQLTLFRFIVKISY